MTISKSLASSGIFSVYPDREAIRMLEFYLYYAAPLRISPMSLDLENAFSDTQKNQLMLNFCSVMNCAKNDLIFQTLADTKANEIDKAQLSDETIVYDRPKGFFWLYTQNKQQGGQSESEFDCLIKHIRNSIAHGRMGQQGEFALLEDKGKKNITMRLIVPQSALLQWTLAVQQIYDC